MFWAEMGPKSGVDSGFSKRGFGQTSAYISLIVINVKQVLFSQEKVWSKDLRWFILGGSNKPLEPPLDAPQAKVTNTCIFESQYTWFILTGDNKIFQGSKLIFPGSCPQSSFIAKIKSSI